MTLRFCCCGANLSRTARIRPVVNHIVRAFLLGSALTVYSYSQSLPFNLQPPVPAAQQGFGSQSLRNEVCGSQFFSPGYAPFLKAHAPLASFSLRPSSSSGPALGSTNGCHPFAINSAARNSPTFDNEASRTGALFPAELRGASLNAWDQGQSAPKSSHSSAGKGSPKHIFGIVPAFHVAYTKQFKPLTPREKFDEWLQGTYDLRGLGLYAFESATLEHSSSDGFCGYGHGWGSYGKCFGSVELDSNISSFFGDLLFPVVLHQDPRYFRLGEGSFGRRMWYAISRVFITHADSGRWVFSSSTLSGSVIAAAASNLYYPAQDRGFGSSVDRLGLDLGDTALFNVAAEFWPDIQNKLHRMF